MVKVVPCTALDHGKLATMDRTSLLIWLAPMLHTIDTLCGTITKGTGQ